ncbi:GTP cyclohydrolase I FolE2 [bacterium]|nr:GTP cyclohydrolase I FolE2 [bacterium]
MNSSKLKDVQNLEDTREVDIQKVGINNVDVPLRIQRKNNTNQTVNAKVRMSVSLPRKYRGTHMSRFVEILNLYRMKDFSSEDIKCLVSDIKKVLKAESANAKFSFQYFIEKKSPVTKLSFPLAYDCSFEGNLNKEDYKFTLGVKVPIATLCPCSKEISEFSAHNQRAAVKLKVKYNQEIDKVWPEDLIEMVESCASVPLYAILKRSDEKYVTEKAYQNPKFVEDILRDLVLKLRKDKRIKSFETEIEAFESIHNHNAWAYQSEGI